MQDLIVIEAGRRHYNTIRPHASIGTPNGQLIDGRGIVPDFKVDNSRNKDADAQLEKAIELLAN